MNYRIIIFLLGWVLLLEAAFMMLPCLTALFYGEGSGLAFLIVALVSALFGFLLVRKRPKRSGFFAKEGFVSVALSWLVLSFVGALPMTLSGAIPTFIDALFETISGFTTTGASILRDIEVLDHGVLLWRSFTHWIGGMGVLVFMLAILPLAMGQSSGQTMHLMRAESPGPSVGKLVPRLRTTALILYGIYFGMTVLQIIMLLFGGMPLFDAVTIAFGTAGTGGFAITNNGIAAYDSRYLQTVITVFMLLFGVNFNIYFLLLWRKPKDALLNEELRTYFIIVTTATLIIAVNTHSLFSGIGEALHHAAFQVSTIITTTGFATTDTNLWPELSKNILLLLMVIGACAGSTGGGIKVSRLIILVKAAAKELSQMIHPRSIKVLKLNGRKLEPELVHSTLVFFIVYVCVLIVSTLLLALDNFSFDTTFSAVLATLNNIGPGFGMVGATGNYADFSIFSKLVLMFNMLAGRLELFPMLLLFSPAVWKR